MSYVWYNKRTGQVIGPVGDSELDDEIFASDDDADDFEIVRHADAYSRPSSPMVLHQQPSNSRFVPPVLPPSGLIANAYKPQGQPSNSPPVLPPTPLVGNRNHSAPAKNATKQPPVLPSFRKGTTK